MLSDWEKQILAYCIRVSRGNLRKGVLKIQITDATKITSASQTSIINFIEMIAYVMRLKNNLKDQKKKRGFDCHIEIGQNIPDLMHNEKYSLDLVSSRFPMSYHQEKGDEVRFYFTYKPSEDHFLKFEDIKLGFSNGNNHTMIQDFVINASHQDLENKIQKEMSKAFSDLEKELDNASENDLIIDTDTPHQTPEKTVKNYASDKDVLFDSGLFPDNEIDFIETNIIDLQEDDVLIDIPFNTKDTDNKTKVITDLLNQINDIEEFEFIDDLINKDHHQD